MHVNVLRSNYPQIGERLATNFASLLNEAFEYLGGKLPIYDFTPSPPAPVPARYPSWSRAMRSRWTEFGSPLEDDYTNGVGTREA
jgi:hypothetical protein